MYQSGMEAICMKMYIWYIIIFYDVVLLSFWYFAFIFCNFIELGVITSLSGLIWRMCLIHHLLPDLWIDFVNFIVHRLIFYNGCLCDRLPSPILKMHHWNPMIREHSLCNENNLLLLVSDSYLSSASTFYFI